MEKITLLISCFDWEYGAALSKGISNLHKDFKVILEKKKREEEVDFYDQMIIQYGEKKIKLLLLETLDSDYFEFKEKNESEDLERIYKYSSISDIVKQLKLLYCKKTGMPLRRSYDDKQVKIIGFYGLSGGCGKTVLAIGTGRELCRYRENKVLYLNWEEFDSNDIYFQTYDGTKNDSVINKPKNLNYYLYYLFSKNKEQPNYPIDCFVHEDSFGLEFFSSTVGRNQLKTLNLVEIEKFLDNISESKRYQYILIDFNRDLTEETIALINLCDRMVFVREDTYESREKALKFFQFFHTNGICYSGQDWVKVNNKAFVKDEREESTPMEEDQPHKEKQILEGEITVFFDANSLHLKENNVEISIENLFGMGVKEIAAELTRS